MKNNKGMVYTLFGIFILIFILIMSVYIANFHSAPLSADPANWGALGDYFGGLLNPALSAMTLLFVALTYMSQKEELQRVRASAELMDELRRQETQAQISLSERYKEQNEISKTISRTTLLNSLISLSMKEIEFHQSEIARATESQSHPASSLIGLDGIRYRQHQDKADYINMKTREIVAQRKVISAYMIEIEKIEKNIFE